VVASRQFIVIVNNRELNIRQFNLHTKRLIFVLTPVSFTATGFGFDGKSDLNGAIVHSMSKTRQDKIDKTAKSSSPGVSRQNAMWLSVVMLVIGFIAGTIFGVMKAPPVPGGSSPGPQAVSNDPPAEMFAALETEAAQNPENPDIWARLGHAYFDASQFQKAIDAYEKSLAIAPNNPNVLTDLGVMYRRNKQPEKAVEMFDRAIAVDPEHEVSRMNKGIVLMHDLNDTPAALKAWEELLEINPLATFGDGRTLDEIIQHYREGHEES